MAVVRLQQPDRLREARPVELNAGKHPIRLREAGEVERADPETRRVNGQGVPGPGGDDENARERRFIQLEPPFFDQTAKAVAGALV